MTSLREVTRQAKSIAYRTLHLSQTAIGDYPKPVCAFVKEAPPAVEYDITVLTARNCSMLVTGDSKAYTVSHGISGWPKAAEAERGERKRVP